jgi:RimJ/RimL family protein N-acetyltransferase
MIRQHIFETERLLIRRFSLDDAPAYFPLISLPDVIKYTADRPLNSVDEAAELLRSHPLRDYELYGYGRMACIEKTSRRLIGFTGLKYLDDMMETDIGYRFLPDVWGKGYATESAAAIMDNQPAEFGLTRIIGLVEPENSGSARVLSKLGLQYERRIHEAVHGELDLYAIDFSDKVRSM